MTDQGNIFGRLHQAVRDADRVLLLTHQKPDGDAAGSATALLGWLVREGKDVTAFCRDTLPKQLRFLDHGHLITQDISVFDSAYDVIIALDSGDLKYCGVHDLLPRVPQGYILVAIDHHPTNQMYGHMNVVDGTASSTCEILHRFFDANGIQVDQGMATSLLTGILYDTSTFTNSATTPECLAAASSLIAAGARTPEIQTFFKDKTVGLLKVWGLMLSRLTYVPAQDMAATYLLEKDFPQGPPDADGLTSGFSNFLNAVTGQAGTIIILHELPSNMVKGSLRSVDKDVSAMAKKLGGGGHIRAAGFTVKGRIQETENGPKIIGSDQPVGTLGF